MDYCYHIGFHRGADMIHLVAKVTQRSVGRSLEAASYVGFRSYFLIEITVMFQILENRQKRKEKQKDKENYCVYIEARLK